MKTNVMVVSAVLCLTACTSSDLVFDSEHTAPIPADTISQLDQSQYLNLSAKEDKDTVKAFWTVDRQVNPPYPKQAAVNNISGCADVLVAIGHDGKPAGLKVVNAYPKGMFEQTAVSTLKKWRWSPSAANSSHQPVLTRVQLDFMVDYSENANIAQAESQCGFDYKMRKHRQSFK